MLGLPGVLQQKPQGETVSQVRYPQHLAYHVQKHHELRELKDQGSFYSSTGDPWNVHVESRSENRPEGYTQEGRASNDSQGAGSSARLRSAVSSQW